MKIAIPTNDGFTINPQFTTTRGFLVSTIQFGEVVGQEMRWNEKSEFLSSEDKYLKELTDCDRIIVKEIDSNQGIFFQLKKKEVIKTNETLITKVLMEYLGTAMQKESNTFCCP
jgi:predicted Fe-Mo cluster-binding NifX family protein